MIPWKDAALRLAFWHVLDSIVHVNCSWFFWKFDKGRTSTSYINNSELLTVLLIAEVGLYVSWALLPQTTGNVDEQRGNLEKYSVAGV